MEFYVYQELFAVISMICLISARNRDVGTHLNCLVETVQKSTHNLYF